MNKRAKGEDYEVAAAQYLEKNGIKVLERNFRCRLGEIDIIGTDKNRNLIFFEVKYRKNDRYGFAHEAVDLRKQGKICSVSDYFRISHRQYGDYQVRYDVIAFTDNELTWIKNAFMYHRKERNNGYSFGM